MNYELRKWLPNSKATVLWNNKKYGYDYICNRVLCIAEELHDVIGAGNNVAIYMERCPDVMYSMLAALISGNVYVPIDTIMPKERVDYIINNAEVKCVITTSEYEKVFPNMKVIISEKISGDKKMNLANVENPDAYIMYTSGTTGVPKGVCISKDNLHTFIQGVSEKIHFAEGTSIACFTSYSFDIFFLESIMALHEGLEVCFADEHQKNNPVAGLKYLVENQIKMLQLTPSRMQQYINCDSSMAFLDSVETLMIGGEEVPLGLLQKIQKKSKCKIYNMYGPTEATIWASIGDLTNSMSVHIGEALKDTELYIINEEMEQCKQGTRGELCISGKLLSKGYYNNEELTQKKFVRFGDKVIYRTGDIASVSEEGKLYVWGRVDNQVKVHGYRIELEEIENTIIDTSIVNGAVVSAVDNNGKGDKKLVAFLTADKDTFDIGKIKALLAKRLPQYMIPDQFFIIDEFPLTVSGKVDRNKVIKKYTNELGSVESSIEEEFTDFEEKVIRIVKASLESNDVRIAKESDLGALGIDSVSFVKMIVDIECEFNVEFDVEELFDSQTSLKTIGELLEFTKKIIVNRN